MAVNQATAGADTKKQELFFELYGQIFNSESYFLNSQSYFLNSQSYFLHAGHAAILDTPQNFELWQHRRDEHVARFAEFRRKKT